MKTIIRSIDIGYGNVKFTTSGGKNMTLDHFPSVTVKPDVSEAFGLDNSIVGIHKRDVVKVNLNGESYQVGKDIFTLNHQESGYALHDNYINTEYYKALTFGALRYMNVKYVDRLVLGLPVFLYEKHKKQLVSMFTGTNKIEKKYAVDVREVKVVPQPYGGLIHFLNSSKCTRKEKEGIGLSIDFGFHTFDWIVANQGRPDLNRAGVQIYYSYRDNKSTTSFGEFC